MADPITVTISDDLRLAGIAAARVAYVAALPAEIDDPDKPGTKIANPALLADEAAYVQHVMSSAVTSYLVQSAGALADQVRALSPKNAAPLRAAIEAAVAVDVSEKGAALEVAGGGAVRVGP